MTKTRKFSRAAMLLLMMLLTTASAWAQDPQEPDLGYIVCDPANVIGGSLSFYKSFDSETGLSNEIAIDGTTHQSERLYSSELSMAGDGCYRVYFTPNPDATHRLSGIAVTIEKNGDSTQSLYWFVENASKGFYYLELPEDADYVNVKATFADSFGTALGDEGHPHVSYITFDDNGVKKTVRTDDPGHPIVYVVDGSETHLGKDGSDTWYIIKGNLNYGVGYGGREATLTLDGHVHLILADGASMRVSNDSGNEHATLVNGNHNYTITTYGQGGATEGKLTLVGNNFEQMLKDVRGLTINGGIMESSDNKIDLDLVIRGGKVTITPSDYGDNAIYNNTTTILGGQVTVNGKIEAGNITLGCTTATDFIKANSYDIAWDGSLTIAPGQVLTYEGYTGDMLMGTLDNGQIAAIAGQTLTLDAEATYWKAGQTVGDVLIDGSTAQNAYIISNTAGLDLLAMRVNSGESYSGKFFKLNGDITYTHTTDWNDAESTENNYTTIGQRLSNYTAGNHPFSGTFDGDGHTVSGIRIYKSGGSSWSDSFQGLFGYVIDGTVKNVTLADARITGEQNVGGIVGWLDCDEGSPTIENCHVLSNVTIHAVADESYFHGGIAGDSDGSVLRCTSAATLTIKDGINGCEDFGGIVGRATGGTLRHNMAIGCTIPAVDYSGAIAGENFNNRGTFEYNYYGGCTVAGVNNADITANDGAVPATELANKPVGSGYVAYNSKYYAPTCRTVVMNASGIRTLATVDNFDFKDIDGLTAYIVNAFNGTAGTLTLASVGAVPAGTGLLLKGTASTTFVVPFTASAVAPTTNYLVGVTDGTTVVPRTEEKGDGNYTNFILANGSQGINWYTLSEAGAIGAYKAYLSLPTDELNLTSGAPSFTWVYGDGSTTAIEGPSPDPSLLYGGEWYDLNGRRLSGKPTTKGLYIHNGRKEVVR